MAVCESFATGTPENRERDASLILIKGIDGFIRDSVAPLQDFLEADQVLAADGLTLTGVISQIAEAGTTANLGPIIQTSISALADSVQLAGIRFLSGWIALNNSDFKTCIDECEKISEPFASVYTLIGQASLELGDITDALEALAIATSLDANEPMSWFQLAKAQHIAGNQEKSWEALDRAEQITGPDLEVCSMRAFVALVEPRIPEYLEAAWSLLLSIIGKDKIHPSLAVLLIELSFARSDLDGTRRVIQTLAFEAAATDADFKTNLPRTLRRLQEFGRMDLASALLDGILNATNTQNQVSKKGA